MEEQGYRRYLMMKKRRRKKTGGNNDEEEEKKEDRGKHDTVVPFMSSHYMCCIIWIVNIDYSLVLHIME